MNATNSNRATFGGRIAAVLAAAGSAIGLGNVWRFPGVADANGGGAFIIIYIVCVALMGLPLMVAEFAIGRHARSNPVGAFRAIDRRWGWLGALAVATVFLILGYYFVVSGWTVAYVVNSAAGRIDSSFFTDFISDPWQPLLYAGVFIAANHYIVERGVKRGIERASKILMPIFFVILLALAVYSLSMPESNAAIRKVFTPDFGAVDSSTVLAALSQAFFSLSIGMGIMITYGSYFKSETRLLPTAVNVALLDSLAAIIASIVILSAGVGDRSGSTLAFVALPEVFDGLPWGGFWSTLFFILLALAAILSTVSIHEVVTVYLSEQRGMTRRRAARCVSLGAALLAVAASLSMGAWDDIRLFGRNLFDLLDT
ncbi:MAG: sodium-dependent transporter, partial [Alistipes sp.]|nr:sodium-dependent transporter [Alistipes sp.]